MKEALFWKTESKGVRCNACRRHCLISDGKTGFCKVRKNIDGKLVSLSYGKNLTSEIDPIEKKPLFHFFPGSKVLGVSTFGCNFACQHCQNYHISKEFDESMINSIPFTSPEKVIELALKNKVQGIAYTYTEPTIFIEYALDIMKLAKENNLFNVFVSNGYMTKEVLKESKKYLDAINVDLKGSSDFYKNICGNVDIQGVKESIEWIYKNKIHLELTYLIVPSFNDKKEFFEEAAEFVLSMSDEIPLHFSAFFPTYKLNFLPRTSPLTVHEAKKTAEKKGIKYVYAGNLRDEENSYCPNCKNLLVFRLYFDSEIKGIKKGKCIKCGKKADFVLDSKKS
ncbi:MAG: AmmeMemoRadiSam system radical SAM enzyme [Candidatus Diapherotrites archaeon CG10_big_fil_rev_8_21_14_0_10_31_34]|nr:MAG: AmmeMemoRadiSam system radical SAM enzyme [Candidatus Diapherotrites archaeon CG10_big_fil_rev_8_21_14_0_10_31_34]